MCQLFFDEESIYEISKPYPKFLKDGRRTDICTYKPKAICPFTFIKVGGIKSVSDCHLSPVENFVANHFLSSLLVFNVFDCRLSGVNFTIKYF